MTASCKNCKYFSYTFAEPVDPEQSMLNKNDPEWVETLLWGHCINPLSEYDSFRVTNRHMCVSYVFNPNWEFRG